MYKTVVSIDKSDLKSMKYEYRSGQNEIGLNI